MDCFKVATDVCVGTDLLVTSHEDCVLIETRYQNDWHGLSGGLLLLLRVVDGKLEVDRVMPEKIHLDEDGHLVEDEELEEQESAPLKLVQETPDIPIIRKLLEEHFKLVFNTSWFVVGHRG